MYSAFLNSIIIFFTYDLAMATDHLKHLNTQSNISIGHVDFARRVCTN